MSDDEADKARADIMKYALALHIVSAEKHAEGVTLARHSAKIEQLAEMADDKLVVRFRDILAEEGLLDPFDGKNDVNMTLPDLPDFNSGGGDA